MGEPKKIPVGVWAKIQMGEYAPTPVTLQRWCNYGKIQPQAEKIGKNWFVVPNARYVK
jgi:hypothetical protein